MTGDKHILVLCIHGSPKGGLTENLARQALDGARQAQASTRLIHLVDWGLPFFKPEMSPPPAAMILQDAIRQADGIILASPTRYFNACPEILNLINWLDYFHGPTWPLKGKVAGFLAGCEEDGGQSAVNAMMNPLQHLGVAVPPGGIVFHNKNMAEKSEDQWMITDVPILGRNVAQMARLLKHNPMTW